MASAGYLTAYLCLLVLLSAAIVFAFPAAFLVEGALVGFVLALIFRSHLPRVFFGALYFLLLGYAFLGRGFAYIGFYPIYVGEVVLMLGLLALLLTGSIMRILRLPLFWLLILYVVWGAVRTAPFIRVYGVIALRDAVIWGYSCFAIFVAAFASRPDFTDKLVFKWRRWIPWFLIWVPIAAVLHGVYHAYLPIVPRTKVPVLVFKGGDMAVHLMGIAAFLLLGLHDRQRSWPLKDWVYWGMWLCGALAVFRVRSAILTALSGLLLVFVLRVNTRWCRFFAVGFIGLYLVFALNVNLKVGSSGRKISFEQLIANIQSIVIDVGRSELELTKQWRTAIWRHIISYTFRGQYFWVGKGYGINLADADGFQVCDSAAPLRSPHNGHLTILARSGVPGLFLWVALQLTYALSLLIAYFRSLRKGHEFWLRINLWLLVYWLAFMVNGMFDVFLEGPQGGIWFWSIIGFGIAALAVQRDQETKSKENPSVLNEVLRPEIAT